MSDKCAISVAVVFNVLICMFNCLTVGPATDISASKEAMAPSHIIRPAVLSEATTVRLLHQAAFTEAGNDTSDASPATS